MMAPGLERSRGAAWRIWDLHVHSPASIVQGYGGSSDAVWERFITELEALPEDLTVIGINDYWFLDGYKRVREARRVGRLSNLEAIFPVVEMRLNHFGGTAGKLSRVNLHVIFDADMDPDTIQAQFINALQFKAKLNPGVNKGAWAGVVTRESLTDFGQAIKSSVPEEERSNYGSDLEEGFNNLNVSLDDVRKALDTQYFKGRSLIGVGKTEWADIKWNGQSIAAKKDVINSASFIFTAFEDTSRWKDDVEKLRSSNVNHHLLDCSDAHHFADSESHMRLGMCQTWMNTTPSIAGLAYALGEYERRVFVGLEPPALGRVRRSPEHFISRVKVDSDRGDRGLFGYEMPLNSGFVAVVGNKGQGKSALLDCVALAGNSSRNSEFAFLTSKRFLSAAGRKVAKDYYSEIEWATGKSRRVALDEGHDRAAPVSVEYLPQAFVERICNVDQDADDADAFERELRAVLFTHIREEDRAAEKTFDALLAQKTLTSQAEIARLRDELRFAIAEYAAVAAFIAGNPLDEVEGRLKLKRTEVASAQESLEVVKAEYDQFNAVGAERHDLAELKCASDELEKARLELGSEQKASELLQAGARQSLSKMEAIADRASALRSDVAELSAQAEVLIGDRDRPYAVMTVDEALYAAWRSSLEDDLSEAKALQVARLARIEENQEALADNAEALAAADSARERARQRVLQSEERVAVLTGSEGDDESLAGLIAFRVRVVEAPASLDALREKVLGHGQRIHAALEAQLDAVATLYEPASRFIQESEVVKSAGLRFNAELRVLPTWQSVVVGLDGRRNGGFPDWMSEFPSRIEDTSWGEISGDLGLALARMEHDRGDLDAPYRNPANALRRATPLEDFLVGLFDLSWLEVRFGLTGDGLPLSQLSPGQRGLVLALFYLVVDRRTTPLLLDQPEENLDNATIAAKLVPAIHEAAGRRQTVVVTHNANLAVVGDADQVIHCQLEQGRFTLTGGSIAELDVARFALDVLEGTKPAFDNRRHKYEAFPELG